MTTQGSWGQSSPAAAAASTATAKRPKQAFAIPEMPSAALTCLACAQGAPTFFCRIGCTSPDHDDDDRPPLVAAPPDKQAGDRRRSFGADMNINAAVSQHHSRAFLSPTNSDFETESEFPLRFQPCFAEARSPGEASGFDKTSFPFSSTSTSPMAPCCSEYPQCSYQHSNQHSNQHSYQHSYQPQQYPGGGHGQTMMEPLQSPPPWTWLYNGETPPHQNFAPAAAGYFDSAVPPGPAASAAPSSPDGGGRHNRTTNTGGVTHDLARMERLLASQTRQHLRNLENSEY